MSSISIYGSHDASICIRIGDSFRIFEIERLTKQRYASLNTPNFSDIYNQIKTIFNIKGKPILTTIKDALHALDTTQIDAVIIEDYIFTRKNI